MTLNNQLLDQITKNMLAVNPIVRHVASLNRTVSMAKCQNGGEDIICQERKRLLRCHWFRIEARVRTY